MTTMYITVGGVQLRLGYFIGKRRKQFTVLRDAYYGGRYIPKGSKCTFWETRDFGWIKWIEPSGEKHVANN